MIVTNSNYDHLKVGNQPGDPLYEFHVLLEGADIVIEPPMKDERYHEYIQYIGVSMRNEEDLCDGFVMIGVDPTLRDELLDALTIDTVLNNLIIGLPDYAIAIDKETLTVSATTGLGYVGESVDELGLSKENLEQNFSGFIEINDLTYYAGVSASEDQYLVPIMRKSSNKGAFTSSCKLALAAAIILCIITLMTLFRYQKDVLDAVPSGEADPDRDLEFANIDDEEEEVKAESIISSFLERTRARNKRGFEERWQVNTVLGANQTPEMRIVRIVYRLLLLLCLFILLPTLYVGWNSDSGIGNLNNLAYVISGKWEKGVNIFAFTACIFLLCAMYVVSVLLDLILYHIARASDMRVETVCLLLKNAMKYICVIIFVYYGLAQFGVNTQTLLASAGILSLMISLGAKDMVSDILAGFFIIFESTYKVGDYINVGSWSGTVTEIGLRTTKVKKDTDIKIFNNSSMRDIINCEDVIRIAVKMPISYDADIPEIEAILAEELPLIGNDRIPGLVKAPRCDGVSSFEDSSVMILIVMFVERTSRFPATRALNRELKIIFDRRNVEIPFNQIVVHEAKDSTEP
ncbi:MAG: mechanosensitive ion channel family protein [Lachnospiraceae bacterium]|nr:mechanosensitive ion channel family protein [Lachnospiraceae bacterium]